jgi:signal transduction histidine kinase
MKRVVAGLIVVAFMVVGVLSAAHAATQEEAKAMVEKAYAYLQANGKEKAFAEISNREGQFVKGDVYVFVQDFNGVCLANGGNPKFVGMNHNGLKDPNGVYFIKEIIAKAKAKGAGWVDYMWVNPATKKIQPKTTYLKRIEGQDAVMACGVFK